MAIEPYASGYLKPGDGQEIYWETVGNPDGVPAVYLHGGPGSGAKENIRELFDPEVFRAVLFDQRGCGRSRPSAETVDVDLTVNTTQHLIADIEKLRESLGIERWIVTGISWGSALALAYSQAHPERVLGIVLVAVTAGTRRETEWITWDMRRVFPREWEEFAALVPGATGDLSAPYARLLADPDPEVVERAVKAWNTWEDVHPSLAPGFEPSYSLQEMKVQRTKARLISHYWGNGHFLDQAPILENMAKIGHIPGVLIHGRYDVSSPLDTAWGLHQAWPASRLVVIGDEGHGGAQMFASWIDALNDLGKQAGQTLRGSG
ncbi:prolyl aminopeptidase [Kineosporia babensis]|uniref:Proline iminopeptidase n=1 Tax=Kineosporia babensis TaxID=499548 RepID=A0A9X1SY65_9ACTN|nr:prolyl aminopeptidase [Kineosporia babensis]MCD5316947.1 prolyl aminopeptidase [Kineosporia babensis]